MDGMWLAYHRALLMGQMQQQAAAASGPLVGMDLTLCLAAAAAASAGPMMPPAVPELAGLFASAPLCGSPAALLGGEMPTPAVVPVPDLNTSTVMAPMSPAASVVSSLASPSSCGSDLGSVTSTEDEGLQSNVSSPASSLYDSCSSLSSSSETEVDHRAHPNAPEHERACLNCHTTSTPLWRRDARGFFNCNACGLYLRTHGKPRPLRRPRQLSEETLAKRQESAMAMQGAKCANCKSSRTTLWRRDENQRLLCNACGLFYKVCVCGCSVVPMRCSGSRGLWRGFFCCWALLAGAVGKQYTNTHRHTCTHSVLVPASL